MSEKVFPKCHFSYPFQGYFSLRKISIESQWDFSGVLKDYQVCKYIKFYSWPDSFGKEGVKYQYYDQSSGLANFSNAKLISFELKVSLNFHICEINAKKYLLVK